MKRDKTPRDYLMLAILFQCLFTVLIIYRIAEGQLFEKADILILIYVAFMAVYSFYCFLMEHGKKGGVKRGIRPRVTEKKIQQVLERIHQEEMAEEDFFIEPGGPKYDRCVEDDRQYAIYLIVESYVDEKAKKIFHKNCKKEPEMYKAFEEKQIWRIKKQILFEKYGVVWKSPYEMPRYLL